MNNRRALVWKSGEVEKLKKQNRELVSEVKALETQIALTEKRRKDAEEECTRLIEETRNFIDGYNKRIKALADAERNYRLAADELQEQKKKLKKEFVSLLAKMRGEVSFLQN